jgi:hypothetical protein
VSFLENIKIKIATSSLEKKMKTVARRKVFNNLESANFVGILFDATIQNSYISARSFATLLEKQNIRVACLGFVLNNEAITYFSETKGMDFFSIKDVTRLNFPKSEAVKEFCEKDFDLFFDLSLKHSLTLKYIVGMSRAGFKIGISKPEFQNYYDLIINCQDDKNIDFYIQQIKHYLSVIKVAS